MRGLRAVSTVKKVLLDSPSLGFGDAICLQPTIERFRERGFNVSVRARNPLLSPLLNLFGASYVPFWHVLADELYINVEGIACQLEVRQDVNGNRAKAYLMATGVHGLALNTPPRISRQLLPAQKVKTPEGVFVQLYGGEPYKQMSAEWYKRLISMAVIRNTPLWTIVDPGTFDDMRAAYGKQVKVITCGYDITQAMAVFANTESAIVLCSSWLQIAGALGVPAIALLGPTTSGGRVAGYPTIRMAENSCKYRPCWRVSNIRCQLDGSLVSKCLEDLDPTDILEQAVQVADLGKRGVERK